MKLGVKIVDKFIKVIGKTIYKEWKYEVSPEVLNFIEENKGKVKAIMLVGPHTSNWDVFHGMRFQQEFPEFKKWLRTPGKKNLFNGIIGFFVKGILEENGGHELDRTKGLHYLDSITETIIEKDEYIWSLYPEGTRSFVKMKKGFMLALKKLKESGVSVPLILCSEDYKNKIFSVAKIIPADFLEKEGELALWKVVKDFYKKEMAKYPEKYNEDIIPNNLKDK